MVKKYQLQQIIDHLQKTQGEVQRVIHSEVGATNTASVILMDIEQFLSDKICDLSEEEKAMVPTIHPYEKPNHVIAPSVMTVCKVCGDTYWNHSEWDDIKARLGSTGKPF